VGLQDMGPCFPKEAHGHHQCRQVEEEVENIVAAEAPEVIQLFHLYAVVIGPGTEM
jgi:hypothetical protein